MISRWPYIRRWRLTNPDNFTRIGKRWFDFLNFRHKVRPYLVSWKRRNMPPFNSASFRAWFIETWIPDETQILSLRPKPSKLCGDWEEEIGIIDTFILMEVAKKAVQAIASAWSLNSADPYSKIKAWFSDYLIDLHTSYGIAERVDNGNTTSVCLGVQAGRFRRTCWKWTKLLRPIAREMYKTPTPPIQIGCWWFIPFVTLARTSLWLFTFFTLDAMNHESVKCFLRRRRIYLNSNSENEEALAWIFIFKFVCKGPNRLGLFQKMSCIGENWPRWDTPFAFLGIWHWKRMNTWNFMGLLWMEILTILR